MDRPDGSGHFSGLAETMFPVTFPVTPTFVNSVWNRSLNVGLMIIEY